MNNPLPILYSFRRCPYAMRARLAITYADIPVETREIQLKNKPEELRLISPKATVPVLQLPDATVIDESLDIMRWALAQRDPANWLLVDADAEQLLQCNDGEFKHYLDRYKYADRYPEFPAHYYRQQAEAFLLTLENRLAQNTYLAASHFSLLDAAILPFIRQFAAVDTAWFSHTPYNHVIDWLNSFLGSDLFAAVMVKRAVWHKP